MPMTNPQCRSRYGNDRRRRRAAAADYVKAGRLNRANQRASRGDRGGRPRRGAAVNTEERRKAIRKARSPYEVECLTKASPPPDPGLRRAIDKSGRRARETPHVRGFVYTGA